MRNMRYVEFMLRNLRTAAVVAAFCLVSGICSYSQELDEQAPEESAISEGYKVIKNARDEDSPAGPKEPEDGSADAVVPEESSRGETAPNPEGENEQTAEQSPEGRGDDLLAIEGESRYDSRGKRDPFKPFLKLISTPVSTDQLAIKPPIQRYSLDQFRLSGIVKIGNEPKAMVVDPENNTYFLGVGDLIGNKDGEIIEVRESGLLVKETTRYENVYGQVKVDVRESVLAFQKDE